MAEFTPSKKTAQDFNNGVEYIDGQGNETGDALQAETINNLVESALYTQGQADSAKQTAQGALSQVNQVLADKTLLPDVQKNFYNLGAFDSYVPNDDGTGTVTRKTIIITKNDMPRYGSNSGSFPYGGMYFFSEKLSFAEDIVGIKCNKQNITFYRLEETPSGYCLSFTAQKEFNNMNELEAFLSDIVIQLRCKSKYQYTEKVIENQPINTLNQDGEQWLRDEWEKGLNLCPYDTEDVTARGEGTVRVGEYFLLKEGVYSYRIETHSSKVTYQYIFNANGKLLVNDTIGHHSMFVIEQDTMIQIALYATGAINRATCHFMLTRGTMLYPYKPYNGKILHQKDLNGDQLFPDDVNPAQTIGGDWEDKGTVTTSNGIVLHAYKRL